MRTPRAPTPSTSRCTGATPTARRSPSAKEGLRDRVEITLANADREAGIQPEHWGSSYLFPWRFITKRLTSKQRPWRGFTVLDQMLGTVAPFSRWGWSIAVVVRKPSTGAVKG